MRLRLLTAVAAALFTLGLAQPVTAETAKKSQQTETDAKPSRKPTAAQAAARARMKACGAEWREMKKDGKSKNTTWRKFSSECLKRKKAA